MIKLVLTDIDDTLVFRGRRVATPRCMEAIHAVLDAGVLFGPATGREKNTVAYSFRFDQACVQTALVANGMRIYVQGRKVYQRELDREAMERVASVCAEDPRACLMLFGEEGGIWACGATIDQMAEHDMRVLPRCQGVSLEVPADRELVKANLHFDGPLDEQEQLMAHLQRECPELDFVMPVGGIIDITAHGWGKGSAALCVADYLGIAHDEVVAFGDAGNDLQMLRMVPNSVAVANAFAEVREAARWHIGTSEDDAVAGALADIAEAAKSGDGVPAFMHDDVNERYLEQARAAHPEVPSIL